MRGLIIASIVFFAQNVEAQVVSQWRGPERTGKYPDTGLMKEWPEGGPKKIWSSDKVLKGYSSPAMGEQYIYVTGREGDDEYLTALNYQGGLAWQVKYGRAWNQSYPDTRTTPTVYNNKVYMISGQGEVVCHDAQSGEQVWYVNAKEEHSGIFNIYGPSEAPLIVDDKIFYTPAGFETTTIALEAETGKLVWKSDPIPDSAAYVSPLFTSHNGRDMIINIAANWAYGMDPSNGDFIWKFDYINRETRQNVRGMIITNCNTPLYHEGKVLLNKGYDHPAIQLSLNNDASAVSVNWSSWDFDTHMGGYILVDGYLYGSNWLNNSRGNWVCTSWETGETMWEETWNNKGQIIFADGLLYLYEERRGNLALVNPNPEKLDIISSFIVDEGSGPHWAHPVIHNGVLYIRHGEALMAFDLMP